MPTADMGQALGFDELGFGRHHCHLRSSGHRRNHERKIGHPNRLRCGD